MIVTNSQCISYGAPQALQLILCGRRLPDHRHIRVPLQKEKTVLRDAQALRECPPEWSTVYCWELYHHCLVRAARFKAADALRHT